MEVSMAENAKYEYWWMINDEDRYVDPDKALVFQAMRGDDIAVDVGPFIIQFDTGEDRDAFALNTKAVKALIEYLNSKYEGVTFHGINDTDEEPADDAERF